MVRIVALLFLFALSPARAEEAEPPWRASALAFVPKGYVAGAAYRTAGMTGYLAIYPASSDDPKTPGSVFAPRKTLLVKIENNKATAAETDARDDIARGNRDTTMTDPDGDEENYDTLHKKLADRRNKLPPGTEPCDLGAWSEDKDPKGLNVRAEPSTQAKVLGTLPPPFRLKGADNSPDAGWLTEFKIVGYRDGWFLIEGATPPGKDYEDAKRYPKNAPKPYAGRGWVSANKVGANFANGSTRTGGLFQSPHVDAKWTPVKTKDGHPISADAGPQKLFACSGHWGLVEAYGTRGWWRGLCSNQVTNCS